MESKHTLIKKTRNSTGSVMSRSATRRSTLILDPMVMKRTVNRRAHKTTESLLLGSADLILARNIDHDKTIQKASFLPSLSESNSERELCGIGVFMRTIKKEVVMTHAEDIAFMNDIRKQVKKGAVGLSDHFRDKLVERKIEPQEILNAIFNGVPVERPLESGWRGGGFYHGNLTVIVGWNKQRTEGATPTLITCFKNDHNNHCSQRAA